VRFEPATGDFVARDVVTFDVSRGRRFKVLNRHVREPGLSQEEVGVGEGQVPEGSTTVVFRLSGRIQDDVKKSDALSWVAGDETRGVIFEKGVYLSGASGWYPAPLTPTPMRFDVTSFIPEPFLVVTQGGVPERKSVGFPAGWSSETEVMPPEGVTGPPGTRYAVAVHKSAIPTEECSLSAGPYKVASRVVGGVTLSTYFYEQDHADAPLWLDAGEEVVRRYEKLLPPYPHPKFDVVANFFASGYGMPSYTLLGDEVIRYVTAGAKRSKGKIPPGYLDHEYVHGWFGNGLLVDPSDGNWCEALTTYYSNYYAKELESEEAAREYRRGVLEKYAIRVQPDEDYPVREFRTKTEDKDNDVGYGKGSMVFHMLRMRLGDERFFAAVRDLTAKRVGTFVSWKDWLSALDGEWVRPWLERKGLPEVRLSSATAWPSGQGWTLRAEPREVVARGEKPYPIGNVAVEGDGEEGPYAVAPIEGGFAWKIGGAPPAHVEVDAGYHLLRRIAKEDLPYCLNRTLEERGGRVRWKGADGVFAPLAKKLADAAKADLLPAGADSPQDGKPLISLVIASPDEVRTWPKDAKDPVVLASPEKIVVKGKEYAGPQFALLFSHPVESGSRTTFYALSEQAAARAGYVTYYGWEQYVVFENGRPVDRGFLDRTPTGTRRAVVRGDETATRVAISIGTLASDEFEGRFPGTIGQHRSIEWLTAHLREQGFRPLEGDKWTVDARIGVPGLVSDTGDAHPWFGTTAGKVRVEHITSVTAPKDVNASDLDPDLSVLASSSKMSVGVVLEGPDWPNATPGSVEVVSSLFDAPNSLTPASRAAWERASTTGRSRRDPGLLRPWIAGRRARALESFPLLAEALSKREQPLFLLRSKDPMPAEVDVRWEEDPTQAGSVVASWLPDGVKDVVVVGAHFDSHGRQESGLYRGADDNASGVACVLEAIRGLQAELAGSNRGLVVCFFDAEEWGLLGSRAVVADLQKRGLAVTAMVNVDAVGRVRDDTVFVLGLSKHPELAKKAGDALATQGLKVGRDIDAFGYEHGSDHWPFHRAGIPAITLWASDYATMDSLEDTPEKVDPVGVVRISKSLRALLLRLLKE
jgi:hypothetical protein